MGRFGGDLVRFLRVCFAMRLILLPFDSAAYLILRLSGVILRKTWDGEERFALRANFVPCLKGETWGTHLCFRSDLGDPSGLVEDLL